MSKVQALSYEKAESYILQLLKEGGLEPGDRFMPEREIAKQLKVSQASVRRAMGKYVSCGLFEKVQGRGTFVKSIPAATGRIAVLHTHNRAGIFKSSFYTDIIAGIEGHARKTDRSVRIVSLEKGTAAAERIIQDLADEVDGFILLDPSLNLVPDLYVLIKKCGKATVSANTLDMSYFADGVVPDNFNDMGLLVKYLADMGHRCLGFALHRNPDTNEPLPNIRARLAAFQYHLVYHSLGFYPDFVMEFSYRRFPGNHLADSLSLDGYLNTDADINAFEAMMNAPEPPTALVCTSDEEALYVYKLAHRAGVSIPDRLSVVGYDDLSEAAAVRPRLTTVRTDLQELGRLALVRLEAKMDEYRNGVIKHHNIILPGKLVERESVTNIS